MRTISIPSITIPDIEVDGMGLQVISGTPYSNSVISISIDAIKFQCVFIVREEMTIMRKNAYETMIDYERLQSMVDSADMEMRNLAYLTLDKYTRYSSRIIEAIRTGDRFLLELLIKEYIDNNDRNITEIVK